MNRLEPASRLPYSEIRHGTGCLSKPCRGTPHDTPPESCQRQAIATLSWEATGAIPAPCRQSLSAHPRKALWKRINPLPASFPIPHRKDVVTRARNLAKRASNTLPIGVMLVASLPYSPMATFLTVKEAAQQTGKSPSSIRRIIYPILENDHHPDRPHVEPDVKTAKALRVKGENFAWKISEELLRREVPAGSAKTGPESKSAQGSSPDQSRAIIDVLREQLQSKDRQIQTLETQLDRKDQQIKVLGDRMGESNVLMHELQDRLAIAAPVPQPTSTTVESKQGSAAKQNAVNAKVPEKPKKRSFFSLFGKS